MSVDLPRMEQEQQPPSRDDLQTSADNNEEESAEEENEEEDEDEPKLKYAKLTGSLTNVYRSGDSTSAFTVAGDKMVLGTHNGNIHVLTLPSLGCLRTYHAHSATITSLSISPVPPPPSALRTERDQPMGAAQASPARPQPASSPASRGQTSVPNTPSNQIYIATSSLDGHVCISSLLDSKDVQLRNFARPVSTVALSPAYKSDRTYLSGGLAGSLILTIGGKAGVTVDANTNSSAASAGGFLGAFGLGGAGDRGTDKILHSGEGSISTISWSLSGKWVAWCNEEGIKIMRSHLSLGEQSEYAWQRIAHAARPSKPIWEEMKGVWKGRCQWINDRHVEHDEVSASSANGIHGSSANEVSRASNKKNRGIEKLLVGWGDTAWILHVSETSNATSRIQAGSSELVYKVHFEDCVVSGIALYTPSLLAVLAYRTHDDDGKPIKAPANDTPRKGRQHRHAGLAPQLRLLDIASKSEDDVDELPISRFETLAARDYSLGTLFIPPLPDEAPKTGVERGTLDGLWDVTATGGRYASRMFVSSAASVTSGGSSGERSRSPGFVTPIPAAARRRVDAHPFASSAGLKLFIQSPYDCVLAVRRDEKDRLEFLLAKQHYGRAWDLIDARPDLVVASVGEEAESEGHSTPRRAAGSLKDFLADDSRSQTTNGVTAMDSPAEKEKRRIGDLWLQQLISDSRWSEAGEVAAKVLASNSRWEHWIWTFAQAGKFDEITPRIPADIVMTSVVYEVVLGHYLASDPRRLKELLEQWDGLFDVSSVRAAVEQKLDGEEDNVLEECLAKLYLAEGRAGDALRSYIRVQDAEGALRLLREEKAGDLVRAEDVSGLLMLNISTEDMQAAPLNTLSEKSEEAVQLLAAETQRGRLQVGAVIEELRQKGRFFRPFIYFYLRALWLGGKAHDEPRRKFERRIDEGHALVEDYADLAVELFADYDRDLLLTFLKASEVYNYEAAAAICESRHYIPEWIHILSKTGQLKRALALIIDELGDVKQAIAFAEKNPDLWNDLLDFGMDKPYIIRGLLEGVGMSVDPKKVVRRIPEGLEIDGLKQGIETLMREVDVQASISEGVARVLRGEVSVAMDTLRVGQKRAIKFDVVTKRGHAGQNVKNTERPESKTLEPGHCVHCDAAFHDDGKSPTS